MQHKSNPKGEAYAPPFVINNCGWALSTPNLSYDALRAVMLCFAQL